MNDYEEILNFCSINKEAQEDLLDFSCINSQTKINVIDNVNTASNTIPETNVLDYNLLNNWKKNTNIINLLSSLHTILDNSKWKKIGIYDLMDNTQIKKQYMKAMKIIHPDKYCHLDDFTKKYYNEIYDIVYASYYKHIQQN